MLGRQRLSASRSMWRSTRHVGLITWIYVHASSRFELHDIPTLYFSLHNILNRYYTLFNLFSMGLIISFFFFSIYYITLPGLLSNQMIITLYFLSFLLQQNEIIAIKLSISMKTFLAQLLLLGLGVNL